MTLRRRDQRFGLVLALLLSLTVMFAPVALAHHKDGHDGGPPSEQSEDKGKGSSKDNDGDADNDKGTSYDEDNDTNDGGTPNNQPDEGDNKHPSGKDKSEEKGKSGNQGKSESDPDGDSNGGPDKPNGSGGEDKADQDGNNGCGNDDDFEDDNNGNCGGKDKGTQEVPNAGQISGPAHPTTGPDYNPEHPEGCSYKGEFDWDGKDCALEYPQIGADEKPCDADSEMPGVQPCTGPVAACPEGMIPVEGSEGECEFAEVAGDNVVLGGSLSRPATDDEGAVAAAGAPRQRAGILGTGVLPFTGAGVLGWLVLALAAVGGGFALIRARRNA